MNRAWQKGAAIYWIVELGLDDAVELDEERPTRIESATRMLRENLTISAQRCRVPDPKAVVLKIMNGSCGKDALEEGGAEPEEVESLIGAASVVSGDLLDIVGKPKASQSRRSRRGRSKAVEGEENVEEISRECCEIFCALLASKNLEAEDITISNRAPPEVFESITSEKPIKPDPSEPPKSPELDKDEEYPMEPVSKMDGLNQAQLLALDELCEEFSFVDSRDVEQVYRASSFIFEVARSALVKLTGRQPNTVKRRAEYPILSGGGGGGGESFLSAALRDRDLVDSIVRKLPIVSTGAAAAASFYRYREPAEAIGRERAALFQAAEDAYHKGDTITMRRASNRAHALTTSMLNHHRAAARLILSNRFTSTSSPLPPSSVSSSHPDTDPLLPPSFLDNLSDPAMLDLHLLLPEEAAQATKEAVSLLQSLPEVPRPKFLCLLVGAGSHSFDGAAKIRPATQTALEELKIPHINTAGPDGAPNSIFVVQISGPL